MSLFILFLLSCKDKNIVPTLDLSGSFSGTTKGYAQPINFNGQTTWQITQVADSVFANITYTDVEGYNIPKYKGIIIGDTVIVGSMVTASGTAVLKTDGEIRNKGNELYFKSENIGYVHVEYFLNRD